MSGKSKQGATKKLIDDETLVFLTKQRGEDTQISANIAIEQHISAFRFDHAERFNNWQTDELYVAQANMAEAAFLEKIHDQEMATTLSRHAEDAESQRAIFEDQRTFNIIVNEMKSLTTQCAQNKAAAERMSRAKAVLKERRAAVRNHLARIEARQERERKTLAATQSQSLKNRKLVRGVILRDVEDPEIRIILSGKEFNERTLKEENAQSAGVRAEADKKFRAMVLAQLVINTKEIEQLREEHILHHKYASRYCERELEIIDENEAMLFEHTAKEQKLEAAQKAQIDAEEDRISVMVATALAHQTELRVQAAANSVRENQRREAQRKKIQQEIDAEQREKAFWENEEVFLMDHLKAKDLQGHFEECKKEFLTRKASNTTRDMIGDAEEDVEDTLIGTDSGNLEAQRAREMALLEGLKKEHKNALKRMKAIHLKIRDQTRLEQQKSLRSILATRDDDINGLKVAQSKEMMDLKAAHDASGQHTDEKNSNRMYAMLPKNIAETLSNGGTVAPKTYDNLTYLTATIVNSDGIAGSCNAKEFCNLVNKLYTAMDDCLDGYEDIYKIENGDSYSLVSGVNTEGKNAKQCASNLVNLGLTFCKVARELDMTGQSVDSVHIRIGIHAGSAVGGVANPALPKFSLLGENINITGLLEQSSRPNSVHISGAVHELVKEGFECDVSESIHHRGQRVPTFWVMNENSNTKKKTRGGRARAAAQ